VHVVIAVTIGVAVFRLLPQEAVEIFVAVLFIAGAVFAFREAAKEDEEALVEREAATHTRTVATAFMVIFVAEWGDLTQILTANLAARYHDGLSVAVGAALALWTVAALAVVGGAGLMKYVSVKTVRRATGVVLLLLAGYSLIIAFTG
jgi:putative Ca2+/H+ antiporter (TMEM165/GDT1 family)